MKKIISFLLIAVLCLSSMCSVCAEQGYSVLREPIYNMADSFYSNITKISKSSSWAICDTNGYPLTGYNWEAMGEITDEFIPARKGGLWGYINAEGTVLIPYQFQKADGFSEGIARVLTAEGNYAYINTSGNILFYPPFDYSFTSSDGAICGAKDGLYGYCDTAGSIIIHPQFDMGFDFHEGLAAVKFGGKWGYISTGGGYEVKPTFTHASDFKNGYAVCALSSGYGIIDKKGTKTSAFTFDYIGECDDFGRFPAKSGAKCGYINSQGEWLMQLDYDYCYTFTDGVARVYKDGLWGYINEQGEELVAPSFADCGEYRNNRAFYSIDGMSYGFLTLDFPPEVKEEPKEEKPTQIKEDVQEETPADLSQYENLPAPVFENKCISMKIGSMYARKSADVKELSHAPVLFDGVTMVPLRDVVEYIGGEVTWDEKTQRIQASCNRNRISITVDSKICYINGVSSSLSSPPRLIDGVTMIPARSVVVALGCDLEWVAEKQNIFIRY